MHCWLRGGGRADNRISGALTTVWPSESVSLVTFVFELTRCRRGDGRLVGGGVRDLQLTLLWAVITHSWTNLEKWGCGNILIENPPPPLVRERSSREICVTSNGNRAKKLNKKLSRNSRRVSINPFQLFLSSGKNRSYYHRNPFDWMWR